MKLDGHPSDKNYGFIQEPICEEYISSQLVTLVTTNAVTGIIVVVNTIIREVTIVLITWIGYDTHSEQLTKITNGVFIGLFFNTGILLLLVYGDFSETWIPFANFF